VSSSRWQAILQPQILLMQHRLLPRDVQVVLFSATFPDIVVRYADRFAPNSNQLTLKHEELTVEGIKQLYMDCTSEAHKYEVLVRLYGLMTIGSSIIFVKVSSCASPFKTILKRPNSVATLPPKSRNA